MNSISPDRAGRRFGLFTFGFLLCSALVAGVPNLPAMPASTRQPVWLVPELEDGFRLLYELKPEEALSRFKAWQSSHPEDPLGSAAEAAAYLFDECYRQGVLTSDFFLNNKRFFGKVPLRADPKLRVAFFTAAGRAQDSASA